MKKTILVVAQDTATLDALTQMLAKKSYTVQRSLDAEEALRWLRAHPRPQLLVLDLESEGLDGAAFRQEQGPDPTLSAIPVVLLGMETEAPASADAFKKVGYLQKPLDEEQLWETVERLTTSPGSEILIVDDEEGILRMLDLALTRGGFTVRLATSGAQAVALYQQHHLTIAVVLVDVQMPGLDGPQTLARLQQIDPRVRCCFMSASTGPYSAQELLARGARCLVPKPFPSLAELGHLLGQIIRAAPSVTP